MHGKELAEVAGGARNDSSMGSGGETILTIFSIAGCFIYSTVDYNISDENRKCFWQ